MHTAPIICASVLLVLLLHCVLLLKSVVWVLIGSKWTLKWCLFLIVRPRHHFWGDRNCLDLIIRKALCASMVLTCFSFQNKSRPRPQTRPRFQKAKLKPTVRKPGALQSFQTESHDIQEETLICSIVRVIADPTSTEKYERETLENISGWKTFLPPNYSLYDTQG